MNTSSEELRSLGKGVRKTIHPEGMLRDFPLDRFRHDLSEWWQSAKRRFPWRESRDPYKVLIAEILLHRTKAEQVVPRYILFFENFPGVKDLAGSTPSRVSQLFYSGGLHWRWKLLHAMAEELETTFHGQIPENLESLRSLPGVSNYIASAVRCFAFGYPDPVLDTNTVRVAGRLLGLKITDSSRRSRLFEAILRQLITKEDPRSFNFALIDFAALICRSKNPLHSGCPSKRYCKYYGQIIEDGKKERA